MHLIFCTASDSDLIFHFPSVFAFPQVTNKCGCCRECSVAEGLSFTEMLLICLEKGLILFFKSTLNHILTLHCLYCDL